MMDVDIRERIPRRIVIYLQLILAVLILITGSTLTISGVVLLPVMALAQDVLAIVGAAAMVSTGAALAGGAYIWLTGPSY